jgi:hypothetical protein
LASRYFDGGNNEEERETMARKRASSGQFDEQGRLVTAEAALEEAIALPGAESRVSFRLINPIVTWEIEVLVNPNSHPFRILGGSIRGRICGSPCWTITGGHIGDDININAGGGCGGKGGCPGCASTVTIVGKCICPPGYRGTYGFDGNSTAFNHTLLFLGYGT